MKARTLGAAVLISSIVVFAYFIRIQSTANIPTGQLTAPDAYFYYWQARLVTEQGHLPARDMHRWLPLGRDLGQTLNLYAYALAYAHKVLASIFPRISLYYVTLYAPAVCFCIGLGALCLFLFRNLGLLFSSITGVLLATLPGTIVRSTAGFSDRDSWCLMLGILAVTTYLASLQQTQHKRKRLLWTLTSGFIMFLGGISWEGFGVFLSILLCVELWRFLSSETEEGLRYYLIWVCSFVPTLYLASPAYRSGQFFATHLFVFMLVPPLVLLGIRTLRHLLVTRMRWVDTLKLHSRTLALGLTLVSIALALGYVFGQHHTFAETTVSFSQNALMQSVGELEDTSLFFWMFRYGSVFILGGLGVIMTVLRFWKIRGLVFAVPLSLFTVTTFYRSVLDTFFGTFVGNILFGVAIASCVLGFIILAWRQHNTTENELTYIAFITWFLFWVALARNAQRHDFFIGISIAFFTADTLCFLTNFYGNKVKHRVQQRFLKTAIITILLSIILFWTPVGGHANRTMFAATLFRLATPGRGSLAQAFNWMKTNLPNTAVVAAHWNHGSQLNVLAGVKTIVDQDHYLQYWIHLYHQHVNFAKTERETLEFLKTHDATHLMLTGRESATAPLLRESGSNALVPIYPTENFEKALVKIWEIHYPSDIQPNPKYLATEPEE